MAFLSRTISDLRRRGVFRVAGIYAVMAWAVSEVAISVEEPLGLPGWIDTSVIVVLGLGFPAALVLAYVFNLTPEGIEVDDGEHPAPSSSQNGPNLVLGMALAVAIGIIGWQTIGPSNDAGIDGSAPLADDSIADLNRPVPGYDGRKAIAVLPFVNMSGDADQGYLADGIAEDIITELYSFKTFPVIARTSTFRYKDEAKDVREIAAELGAGYVLEGSVRRIGERIRITAQLIDANGDHLWAERYDRLWSEILEVHDEITYSIVEAIEPELIYSETERRRHVGTEDQVAWDYYLRARAMTAEEFSPTTLSGVPVTIETNREAWRLANLALEKAPNFAALYSLLAHIDGVSVLWLSQELGPDEIRMAIERSLENSARARTLDPFEATACACQVSMLLLKGDVVGAVEVGESALEENPGSAFVLAGLAKALQVSGNFERALELILKAKRLSPKGISMSTYLTFEALIRQSMGDMEAAMRLARQAQRRADGRGDAEVIHITSLLAEGRRAEALEVMHQFRRDMPQFSTGSLWPEPFPDSVRERLPAPMRSQLRGAKYAEGVSVLLRDLGWQTLE